MGKRQCSVQIIGPATIANLAHAHPKADPDHKTRSQQIGEIVLTLERLDFVQTHDELSESEQSHEGLTPLGSLLRREESCL